MTPQHALDGRALERVLAFAFLAGDDGGVLAGALEQAPLAFSTFEPTLFARELFLEELIQGPLSPRVNGRPLAFDAAHVLRLLSHPPRSVELTRFRGEAFRELAMEDALRVASGRLALGIGELRRLFAGEGRVGIRGEQARRRIDILRAIEQLFLSLDGFASATSSLARIARFGQEVRASEAFHKLSELLRYENARAYADLTLQLGADGSVRGLRVNQLREDPRNAYHVSAPRQWLGRAWLWLKGYRVTDGELIDGWLDAVFQGVVPFLPPLIQLLGDLEFLLAGTALVERARERGLAMSVAEFGDDWQVRELFNPLLLASVQPVPCGLALGAAGDTTLITGPNSGGKTRLLQSLGLLQLLAQNGMFVPAAAARLPHVPGIFASLSQPAGAEQAEGRLGSELLRIRMLFERAQPGSLVLVDELCSGTSPSEGEELFVLVLELIQELSPLAFVSTHFLKLAAEMARASELSLRFVQVELDARERPTYRFVDGVAATSLARQTAARLGVTREELRALIATRRAAQ
ncbi:MAG: DNA mismatch repair protein [Polyangiales bacterium]